MHHLGRLAIFFTLLAVIGFVAAWRERRARRAKGER